MKTFKKITVTVLAGAMLVTAFAGCSNKKKTKTIYEAVADQADSAGAQTITMDDAEDIMSEMDVDDLGDGLYMDLTSEDLSDMDIPSEASMIIDVDDVEGVRVYVRGDINEDSPVESGVGAVAVIKFNEADDASDCFRNIYNYRSFLSMAGLNPDDMSEDELFYDKDEGEGALIVNFDPADLIEGVAETAGVTGDMLSEANFNTDDISRVVICFRVHDDSIILSIAYGDEFIEEIDSVYSAAGVDVPSDVESSDAVLEFISEGLVNSLAEYIERASEAADEVAAHNAQIAGVVDQIDAAMDDAEG